MDVFVDDGGDILIEFKFQVDAVFHIVFWKHNHIRRVGSAGLDRFSPSRMEERFPARTGAAVRMATATAIWAVTAAFTGARSFSERARRISSSGQLITRPKQRYLGSGVSV